MIVGRIYLWMGLVLGNAAHAQAANNRLYDDIVGGGITELTLSLAAGTHADADVAIPNTDKAMSLLELAVAAKNDRAAALLLDVGARATSLEGRFGNSSALETLAQQGMLRTLSMYVERDTNALVRAGSDSLIVAVAYGQLPAAKLLLDRMRNVVGSDRLKASIDEALIFAAGNNDAMATKLLLAYGADPGPPLIAAVVNCSPDSTRELLSYTVKPLPSYQGEHVAAFARRCLGTGSDGEEAASKFSRIVQLLYDTDASICPVLRGAQREESAEVNSALQKLDLCQ